MSKHESLFLDGSSKREVYLVFHRDYIKSAKLTRIWGLVVGLAMLGCVVAPENFQPAILLFGLMAIAQLLMIFTDNSNRNWAMHVIDWIEHQHQADIASLSDERPRTRP